MRSANPVLTPSIFTGYGYVKQGDVMTMQGVVIKTGILLILTLLSAAWTWIKFYKAGANPAAVTPWMMAGVFGGLGVALVTAFKPTWSAMTAPAYAVLEGLFLGGISAMMEASFPGIAMQAVSLTFGTMFVMLAAYSSGLIRATEKFKFGVIAATGGIALVYLVSWILSFFHIQVPFIYGGGWMGIGFSLFVVVIAALNLIIDFDFIEQATKRSVPKYMEWYSGFALMVTLIWLYVEFLRLLSQLRSRE